MCVVCVILTLCHMETGYPAVFKFGSCVSNRKGCHMLAPALGFWAHGVMSPQVCTGSVISIQRCSRNPLSFSSSISNPTVSFTSSYSDCSFLTLYLLSFETTLHFGVFFVPWCNCSVSYLFYLFTYSNKHSGSVLRLCESSYKCEPTQPTQIVPYWQEESESFDSQLIWKSLQNICLFER